MPPITVAKRKPEIRGPEKRDGRLLGQAQAAEMFTTYREQFPASKGKISFSTFQRILSNCGPETGITEIAAQLRALNIRVARRTIRQVMLTSNLRTAQELEQFGRQSGNITQRIATKGRFKGQSLAQGPIRQHIVDLLHAPKMTINDIATGTGVSSRSIMRINQEENHIRAVGHGRGEKKFAQVRRREFLRKALVHTRVPFSRIIDRIVKREGLLESDKPSIKVALGRVKREEEIKRSQFRATNKDQQRAAKEFSRIMNTNGQVDLIRASGRLNMPIYFVRTVFAEQARAYAQSMIKADRMDIMELHEKTRLPLEELEKMQQQIWKKNGWI